MLKLVLFCGSLCCTFFAVAADSMIGPGKWKMLKMEKKPCNMEKFEFNIVQRKYNRSHDMFQGSMIFHEELNGMYGGKIDVCKHVDGGCKQFQLLHEPSFVDLVLKYAEGNFKDMISLGGHNNADFPVPMGEYKIDEYLWDWDSMPEEGPYGRFIADCCVMEGSIEVGCLCVEILFEELDEDDDEE